MGGYHENQLGRIILCDIIFHYHAVVLRQLCVRNEFIRNVILFQFFKWADEYEANKTGSKEVGQKSSSKLTVSSPDSLMSFLKSHVS